MRKYIYIPFSIFVLLQGCEKKREEYKNYYYETYIKRSRDSINTSIGWHRDNEFIGGVYMSVYERDSLVYLENYFFNQNKDTIYLSTSFEDNVHCYLLKVDKLGNIVVTPIDKNDSNMFGLGLKEVVFKRKR